MLFITRTCNDGQAPPHAQERLVALLEDGTYRQMDGLPATGMGQAADASEGEGQLHQSSARIILTSQQAYTFPASCKVQEIKVIIAVKASILIQSSGNTFPASCKVQEIKVIVAVKASILIQCSENCIT